MIHKIKQRYRKDLFHPLGYGYNLRPEGSKPESLIIHSTNGKKGSSFAHECRHLRDSPTFSCGYAIGKSGQIEQILPDELCGWHIGPAHEPFVDETSIGIECHHSIGELWPEQQLAALTWLCEAVLIPRWNVRKVHLETHRAIAIPKGRKIDPADWNDAKFYAWRDELYRTTDQDRSVLGVKPSISMTSFIVALQAHQAPLSPHEMARVYRFCQWLTIDPNFLLQLWLLESGSPLGGSVLQQQTHCPINLKIFRWENRDSVIHQAAHWAAYESFQLGTFEALIYLKQQHGAHGRHTVRAIIPVHAPREEGNDPERIILTILDGMRRTETNQ